MGSANDDARELLDCLQTLHSFDAAVFVAEQFVINAQKHSDARMLTTFKPLEKDAKDAQKAHEKRIRELAEIVLKQAYQAGLHDPQNPLDELLAATRWRGEPFFTLCKRCEIYVQQLIRLLPIQGPPKTNRRVATKPTVFPFVPSPFQKSILAVLEGRAMRTDALANKLRDRRKFFREKKELQERGLLALHRKLGFYRPDAPPPELSAAPK